ncbi:FAD-dependent oxidoreductase, partial [Massilia pinisoli]|uniref:FAD-dependent oxidoreductase n=1 Tax=Massilia pinisoli TaxID=1772194 RepID=UPI003644EDC6
NGKSTLTEEQNEKLEKHHIRVIETGIDSLVHTNGYIEKVVLADGSSIALDALYSRPVFVQHSNIPQVLGCELADNGLIQIDGFQKTTVPGVFACGDNSNPMRSVAMSVASGATTGAMVNHELIGEEF